MISSQYVGRRVAVNEQNGRAVLRSAEEDVLFKRDVSIIFEVIPGNVGTVDILISL
jgi:hypothetical protein